MCLCTKYMHSVAGFSIATGCTDVETKAFGIDFMIPLSLSPPLSLLSPSLPPSLFLSLSVCLFFSLPCVRSRVYACSPSVAPPPWRSCQYKTNLEGLLGRPG